MDDAEQRSDELDLLQSMYPEELIPLAPNSYSLALNNIVLNIVLPDDYPSLCPPTVSLSKGPASLGLPLNMQVSELWADRMPGDCILFDLASWLQNLDMPCDQEPACQTSGQNQQPVVPEVTVSQQQLGEVLKVLAASGFTCYGLCWVHESGASVEQHEADLCRLTVQSGQNMDAQAAARVLATLQSDEPDLSWLGVQEEAEEEEVGTPQLECLTATDVGVLCAFFCKPNAKCTQLCLGALEAQVGVQLAAPPRDGQANKELLQFAVETFGARKADVALVSGAASRNKVVSVAGVSLEGAKGSLHRMLKQLEE